MAAALIVLAVPNVASAQIPGFFTVDTQADGADGECSADCTLREAVTLAGPSGGSVSVPPGVYKLTRGQLVVSGGSISGTGTAGGFGASARTTIIDARGASRAIFVTGGTSAVLGGVTIRNGRADIGGGILVAADSSLTLHNSHVVDNVATVRGGGVAAAGSFGVVAAAFANNRAANGGGIAVEPNGTALIEPATISDNTATANGGGVYVNNGTLLLWNATVAGNSAASGSAVYVPPGGSGGSFTFWNSILEGAGAGGACGGTFAGASHSGSSGNLADDTTCGFLSGEGTNGVDARTLALRNNGGSTDTRALPQGSPAINAGDQNRCLGSDQRFASSVGLCDVGAFEFGGTPPAVQLPPPVPGETVNASRSRGTVRVKLPGSDEFFVLRDGQQLPMGTTFDTSKGRVNLVSAASNVPGPTQKAWFYQGVFKVRQSKGRRPLTTLAMSGKLQCGGGNASAASARKKKRRLWGDGRGRFRTKGKHSAATVVGTRWLVEDRCNGTLTRVKRGKVRVRDFKRRKTIVVTAGHKYFAKR